MVFKKQVHTTVLIYIFISFILIAPVSAKEFQVGVSPLLLDLGTLDPGEKVVGSFFIVTSSPDEIVVKLTSSPANLDFFKKPANSDIINLVSETDSSGWVYFPSNPYVLKPTNISLNTKGGTISDWKKVNFVLEVPDDAEPCYHAFRIMPTPYISKDSGSAVSIVALVAVTVKFKVAGVCVVSGNVLDIMQGSSANDVILDIYFQNTGTATFSSYSPDVAIYYENGTLVDTASSGYVSVLPGEIGILSVGFNQEKIQPGNYLVNSTVFYNINSSSKQVMLSIEKPKFIPKTEVSSLNNPQGNNTFWIILIIILIVAYFIYRKDTGNTRKL
ncbi:MAG: hypothetical protein KAR23_06215 [Candidatus Aenigmarchaeota archaeon]|nr:hypothetical protein [Candidatus Aenigmarchaeota archaeon]